jgi:hypothetical protein
MFVWKWLLHICFWLLAVGCRQLLFNGVVVGGAVDVPVVALAQSMLGVGGFWGSGGGGQGMLGLVQNWICDLASRQASKTYKTRQQIKFAISFLVKFSETCTTCGSYL